MAGGTGDVKLLGAWPSPFAMRVMFAMNLKKVSYELVETCPFQKGDDLLRANPIYKKIPVLLHGDRIICESMIIVEYVDNFWNCDDRPSTMPSDPFDLAMARFWATVIDDKLFPCMMGMARAQTPEAGAAAAEQLLGAMQLLEGAFEQCSKGGAFFGGATVGYVDICLGGFISWLRAFGLMCGKELFDKEKTPLLAGWVERFCAEEAVKSVMPDTGKMVDFFQNVLMEKIKSMDP